MRQSYTIVYLNRGYRFSPVAGIQWVETILGVSAGREFTESFSPVAGIQWVETLKHCQNQQCNTRVSVPLPGFSGLRLSVALSLKAFNKLFQSRCRDSVG